MGCGVVMEGGGRHEVRCPEQAGLVQKWAAEVTSQKEQSLWNSSCDGSLRTLDRQPGVAHVGKEPAGGGR